MVERARTEHRREGGRVHPDGEALEVAVGEGHEHGSRCDVRRRTRRGGRHLAAVERQRSSADCAGQLRRMRSQSTPTRSTRSAKTSSTTRARSRRRRTLASRAPITSLPSPPKSPSRPAPPRIVSFPANPHSRSSATVPWSRSPPRVPGWLQTGCQAGSKSWELVPGREVDLVGAVWSNDEHVGSRVRRSRCSRTRASCRRATTTGCARTTREDRMARRPAGRDAHAYRRVA